MEMEEAQESVLLGAMKSSLLQSVGFLWSFLQGKVVFACGSIMRGMLW